MSAAAIRLLVSDIDGTLIGDDKLLSPSTIDAVEALQRAGVSLCLASSRSVRGMRLYLEQLGLRTPAAGLNGAEIVAADGAVLHRCTLHPGMARLAIETLRRHGIESWVFAGGEWLVVDPDGAFLPRERNAVRIDPVQVADFAPHLHAVGKIMGASSDHALLRRVELELGSLLGDGVSAHRSSPWYLDITHADANKGAAALLLAASFGLDAAEMACIGDMDNDVAMLDIAGLSIAMGNAPDHVKAAAGHVTAGHNHDGWAMAVRSVVLPRAPDATRGRDA